MRIDTAHRDALADLLQLAHDVLHLALQGGMPSSYWYTDSRIARACEVLDIDVDFAEQYAEESIPEDEEG